MDREVQGQEHILAVQHLSQQNRCPALCHSYGNQGVKMKVLAGLVVWFILYPSDGRKPMYIHGEILSSPLAQEMKKLGEVSS
jgi:hypothetical protein